jgi:hypothetical protein
VAELVLQIGRAYGLHAMRVPSEPRAVLAQADAAAIPGPALATAPWAVLLRRRARAAGIATAQQTFGLAWSGQMTGARVAALVRHLPAGVSEIYLHPATKDDFAGATPGYCYTAEFAGLISSSLRNSVRSSDIRLGGFADVIPGG